MEAEGRRTLLMDLSFADILFPIDLKNLYRIGVSSTTSVFIQNPKTPISLYVNADFEVCLVSLR